MRILITGSRTWTDVPTIVRILAIHRDDENVTLVSGACPTGADDICEEVAVYAGWKIERHPADWTKGKGAGFMRNQKMVDLGADICYAFIKDKSRGATHCADAARKAGIEVRVITK